jgi:polysaccharide export outer membrane protein
MSRWATPLLSLAAALTLAVGLGGCAAPGAAAGDPGGERSPGPYHLGPGDRVTLGSDVVREIDGIEVLVDPAGMIRLPLIGPVRAADASADQLAEAVRQQAARYYHRPTVSVRVTAFGSRSVQVVGPVAVPGAHPYHGGNTLLSLLAAAEPTPQADLSRVRVIRNPPVGPDRSTTYRIASILDGTAADVPLHPGDVVVVPRRSLTPRLPLVSIGSDRQTPSPIRDQRAGLTLAPSPEDRP